jgi:hypothetical protein
VPVAIGLLLAGILGLISVPSRGAKADASHVAPLNPIQIENARPGTTAWEIKVLSFRHEIEGYASVQSASPGQRISFHVSTTGKWFTADVFRMGWYDGKGGRLVDSLPTMRGHRERIRKPNRATGLLVCHWPTSFSITVPRTWVSGMYLVKLTSSNTHQAYIPFVVKESRPTSPLLFIDSVTTSEAYNWWGDKSLYVDIAYHSPKLQYANRAVMVSFERPYAENQGAGWFFSWEIHMVRWMEARGYNVSYINDLDINDNPGILLHRKGLIISGHDEYWSLSMRTAMDEAVAHGVSLANFAANTGYWQVRLAPQGSNGDGILICYKDFARDPMHKSNPRLATVEWRSPQVHLPESMLLGAMYEDYEGPYGPYAWVVKDPKSWVFAGTGLKKGSSIAKVVGHEEDAVLSHYPHPKNLTILSVSPVKTSAGRKRTSNATIYRAPSGAYVFDAGTIDWSYGLDDLHLPWFSYPPARRAPSQAAEKITANVLGRFLK